MSKPVLNTRPLRPHRHICRACPRRHSWDCKSTACSWAMFLSCAAGKLRAAGAAGRIQR